jgi:hypothetical protein
LSKTPAPPAIVSQPNLPEAISPVEKKVYPQIPVISRLQVNEGSEEGSSEPVIEFNKPAVPSIDTSARSAAISPQSAERVYAESPVIFQLQVNEEEAEAELLFETTKSEKQAPVAASVPVAAPNPEAAQAQRPFPQYPDVEALMKNIFPSAPAQKPVTREVNEMVGNPITALNTRLAAATDKKVELAEVLVSGSRIADIRKAISINEKYQMISSLFRGDEDMFERSIRTLNNFGSLPEARFWMQRELILKLGWNEQDELVKFVYRLVNRRFS